MKRAASPSVVSDLSDDDDETAKAAPEAEDEEEDPLSSPMALSEVNGAGFRRGAIVRARLTGFVTYDDVELRPGPGLNVVVGPNGTGKSSVACALALAFAARPQILGRGKEPRDFVKRGQARAVVAVELCGGAGGRPNVTIAREIRADGASRFLVDGRPASGKDVARLCAALRVQVDNLCQFLPQDRVCEFAGLSPAALLVETERAVGPPGMVDVHTELCKLRSAEREERRRTDAAARTLDELRAANDRLQREVDRFKEFQRTSDRVRLLEARRLWMLFEEQRVRAVQLKERLAEAEAEERETHAAWSAAARRAEDERVAALKAREDAVRARNQIDQLERDKKTAQRLLAEIEAEEDGVLRELANLRSRAEEREALIRGSEEELKRLLDQQASLPDLEPLKAKELENQRRSTALQIELQEIHQADSDLKEKLGRSQRALQAVRRQVQELNDEHKRKLAFLERQEKDVYAAFMWIQEHKGEFEAPVFGPILLDCNVANKDYATYLEMQAGKPHLLAFVTQNLHDRETLLRQVYERQKIRITVLNVDANRPLPQTTHKLDDELRRLGVTCTLDQVLKAPHPVVLALCDFCNIHNVLIATAEATKHVDSLPIGITYTPHNVYKRVQSRYEDRSMSTVVTAVRPARILSPTDIDARRRLEEQLASAQQQEAQFNQELRALADRGKAKLAESNEIKLQRDLFAKQKRDADVMARRVVQKRREIEALKNEEDVRHEEQALRRKSDAAVIRRAACVTKLVRLTVAAADALSEVNAPTMQLAELQRSSTRLLDQAKHAKVASDAARKKSEHLKGEFQEAKARAGALKETASKEAPLSEELKENMLTVKMTLEDVEQQISTLKTQLEMNVYVNPRVVSEYESRKREIADRETAYQKDMADLKAHTQRIEVLREKWLPPLRKIVERIHTSFSQFMSEIRCEGAVKLEESEESYEKFEIQILVRFRESTELRKLDEHVQSGGEKSVATMLYLIALQDLTECPFRLVDEINQGMDPINERMIFRQIAASASRPGLPQYFLITPKLLPNLDYTPSMTVHCVFNGPWLDLVNDLQDGSLTKRRRSTRQRRTISSQATIADGDDDDEEDGDF